ncbi:MAG: glutamate racemase [Chloroflexota bacterium]
MTGTTGKAAAIGVFDSGVGGLTVLKEIVRLLPNEDIIYLGDTARVPYGSKPRSIVVQYALEDAGYLRRRGVKAMVVACNTVCAQAMAELKAELDVPVIGMIEPAARAAVALTRRKAIAVIGTEGTVNSGVYPRTIKGLDSGIDVFSQACPLFVPVVEEGLFEGEIPRQVVALYLAGLKAKPADVLILGCTHYPLLKPVIADYLGPGITPLDPAVAVARELEQQLARGGLRRDGGKGSRRFYFTSDPRKAEVIMHHLGLKADSLEVADLAG